MKQGPERRVTLLSSDSDVRDGLRTLAALLSDRSNLSSLVLSAGGRRVSEYAAVANRAGADLVLESGGSPFSRLTRFVFGTRALLQLRSHSDVVQVVDGVGEQSMATVFVLSQSVAATLMSRAERSFAEVVGEIETGAALAAITIDEDAGGTGGRVACIVEVWTDCPSDLAKALYGLWSNGDISHS
jgi:hypothetical protein